MALVINNFSNDPGDWERFFLPYADLVVEAALHLTQVVNGDITQVSFDAWCYATMEVSYVANAIDVASGHVFVADGKDGLTVHTIVATP